MRFLVWLLYIGPVAARISLLPLGDIYMDKAAGFGPAVPKEGLSAYIIAMPDVDVANERGCHPSHPFPTGKPWIALIERGSCSFTKQVRNMQSMGAVGVIVGNNDRSGLLTMQASSDSDESDIHIPSVFVSHRDYTRLRAKVLLHRPLIATIIDDDIWDIIRSNHNLEAFLLLLCALGLCLILLTPLRRLLLRFTGADSSDHPVVLELPKKVFKLSNYRSGDPETCAICLEDFQDLDELSVFTCRHEFHSACIHPWLQRQNRACPLCKREPTVHTSLAISEACMFTLYN